MAEELSTNLLPYPAYTIGAGPQNDLALYYSNVTFTACLLPHFFCSALTVLPKFGGVLFCFVLCVGFFVLFCVCGVLFCFVYVVFCFVLFCVCGVLFCFVCVVFCLVCVCENVKVCVCACVHECVRA